MQAFIGNLLGANDTPDGEGKRRRREHTADSGRRRRHRSSSKSVNQDLASHNLKRSESHQGSANKHRSRADSHQKQRIRGESREKTSKHVEADQAGSRPNKYFNFFASMAKETGAVKRTSRGPSTGVASNHKRRRDRSETAPAKGRP